MNRLTSQQLKLIYLVGIVILLIPIVILSVPSDKGATDAKDGKGAKAAKRNPGGILYQLRSKYDLGESDLGDVDASGAAINLVLLGMRGVAVNLLWMDLDQQKDMKRWQEMEASTESIVRLQPHYEKVWDMAGWNLAYNTSAEWDAVPDRYYWVKQGAKLLKRGVARNKKSTELNYKTGKVLQHKIGFADEAVQYRRYFLHDPDPAFEDRPDPEVNPEGIDNFLAAKVWFDDGCVCELTRPQHILDRTLYRATPGRCLFDYAAGLQKDGSFGEATRAAWDAARIEWTEKYGREVFHAIIGVQKDESDIRMEMTEDDIKEIAKTPEDEFKVRNAVDAYQKMVNYRYWRMRAFAEAEPETSEAHRSLYEAKQAYKAQDFEKARTAAYAGMEGFEKIFRRPEYADLVEEDTIAEEILLGWKIWEDIYQIGEEKVPEEYPLKWYVQLKEPNPKLMSEVTRQFKRIFLETK